jgi:hypothetical protein
MAKYFGVIGYGVSEEEETSPGVWEKKITEQEIFGDVFKDSSRQTPSENLNDNITMSTKISFLANTYANENFHLIKYASYKGTLWKVVSADPSEYPRLVLTLGGVYND